jgi:hypothetical protein
MLQKCLLTGAMCAIAPGSPVQLLVALFVCLSYLLLILHATPYRGNLEDRLAFLTALILTLSLLFGFTNIMDDSKNPTFNLDLLGAILIVLNVFPFLYLIFACVKILVYGPNIGLWEIDTTTGTIRRTPSRATSKKRLGDRSRRAKQQRAVHRINQAVQHDRLVQSDKTAYAALKLRYNAQRKLESKQQAIKEKDYNTGSGSSIGRVRFNGTLRRAIRHQKVDRVMDDASVSARKHKEKIVIRQKLATERLKKRLQNKINVGEVSGAGGAVKAGTNHRGKGGGAIQPAVQPAVQSVGNIMKEIESVRNFVQKKVKTKKRFMKIFQKIDQDQSGTLSKKEFARLLKVAVKGNGAVGKNLSKCFETLWLDVCRSGHCVDVVTCLKWLFG